MIPKVIHYCWFGGNPLPELAIKCIESWKKFFPDYEIKEWNESNFDVNSIPYTAEAYKAKKYAFVSDYARFWILYHYGGLYFDTDVEVIKNMDDIVEKGPFMGCENTPFDGTKTIGVAPGLGLGVTFGHEIYKEMLDYYASLAFYKEDGNLNIVTIVTYTTGVLYKYGLRNINEIQCIKGIYIYPKDYFCPKDGYTGILSITDNTRTIHHYTASWLSPYKRICLFIRQFFASFGIHHTGIGAKISSLLHLK